MKFVSSRSSLRRVPGTHYVLHKQLLPLFYARHWLGLLTCKTGMIPSLTQKAAVKIKRESSGRLPAALPDNVVGRPYKFSIPVIDLPS